MHLLDVLPGRADRFAALVADDYPPYRVYYQRTSHALLVVRIYHQRREPITR
jgi:hypothetical protein